MSVEPVVERSLWRRMSNAVHGTRASRYLAEKKGGLFTRGFVKSLWLDLAFSSPWKSIYPRPLPQTAREQSEIAITSFVVHLHPASIPRKALKFSVTYGL